MNISIPLALIAMSQTKYGSVKYLGNDQYIGQELSKGKLFEQDIIEKFEPFVRESKVILDIGSHVGCHSIAYSKISPSADIFAFEMQTPIYNLLYQNILENNLTNIKPIHKSVGHRVGYSQVSKKIGDGSVKDLDYYDNKIRNYGGVSLGVGGEEVSMVTIDSLGLDFCDYIKIDAEGFEPLIIMGGYETIRKYLPIIFYEANDKTVTSEMRTYFEIDFEIPTTKRLLENLGYDKFIYFHVDNYLAFHPSSKFYDLF